MNKESEQIFSSTGRLGVSRRQFDRLYVNGTGYSDDPSEVDRNFRRLIGIAKRHPARVSRSVFRGLVSQDVLSDILVNGLHPNLEVALPVEEFTGEKSWLIYLAKNSPERSQIVPTAEMIERTERDKNVPTESPEQRVQRVLDQGYRFTDYITEDKVDQVFLLWKDTFGWSRTEVENLRRRLINGDEGLWFSAIIDSDGNIVTATTAEKLDIPAREGELTLVENTEWITIDGHRGKGLMTATLDILNAQVLADLRPNSNDRLPLIYAECNYQSCSDRAGHGAGFEIPQRQVNGYIIPQILIQNVDVGDNQLVPSDKLRDFTFMYLSADTINDNYSPEQVERMLGNLTQL